VLEQAARELATTTQLSVEELSHLLYADLPDQQTLTTFDAPDPKALLERFELAQAQGMLYRAFNLVITAHRNEPARYKQLLTYTKLFGLMLTVEGDADTGFTLTMDGPTSLFGGTTRYGLALAKFLPALLYVTKWDLSQRSSPEKTWPGSIPTMRSGLFKSPRKMGTSATTTWTTDQGRGMSENLLSHH
jgi:predicted nuclease of restriction endonuclease-like RecB superfamily